MNLLVKFNLIFLLVFAIGFGVTATSTRGLLERSAKQEVLDQARLMLDKAMAVRDYTAAQVAPLLTTQMAYAFMPQSVPAFSATEVLQSLSKKYPDYGYKEATLNPTNPRDRAVEWEVDIVGNFRNSLRAELTGERDTATGRSLYVARPIRIGQSACLQCHGAVDTAPKTMLDKYGSANGFGWKLHEVVGAQIVSIPMSVPLKRAQETSTVFLGMLAATFAGIAIALNLMLWLLVVRPVKRLAVLADKVSNGDMNLAECNSRRRDEIGVLIESFGRLRRTVIQAMKMVG